MSLSTGGYMRAVFPGDTAQGYGAASTGIPGILVPATKALTRVTLNPQPALVPDHTCVTGTYVSHYYGRTLVHARVQDWCANGQVTFGPVKGQVVNVYYHPAGSTTWRLIAQPHTDANGFVNYTSYSVPRGYFLVVFPAQGYYLRSASKTVYAG